MHDAGSIQYAKGLIIRGMLNTQTYKTKGKRFMSLYVTYLGRTYLSKL